MVSRFIYDKQFSKEELRKIEFLRKLDTGSLKLSVIVGLTGCTVLFLTQILFKGVKSYHAFSTYGAIPFGVFLGYVTYRRIDTYIENKFSEKWDPLFYSRSGLDQADIEEQELMIKLTENMNYMSLPLEEQKRIAAEGVEKIRRKYGKT